MSAKHKPVDREAEGRALFQKGAVSRESWTTLAVASGPGHIVTQEAPDGFRCDCPDVEFRGKDDTEGACKHVRAVILFLEQEASQRERKGRALAAMGHVTRTEDGFDVVSTARTHEVLQVWRDTDGKVKCSCAEFAARVLVDRTFRCEHVFGVKSFLDSLSDTPGSAIEEAPEAEEPDNTVFLRPPATEPSPGPVLLTDEQVAAYTTPPSSAPFHEVLVELKRPLPSEVVKQRVGWTDRSGRDHEVDYVEWHVVADILDRVAPEWSHAVRDIKQIGVLVAVTASITIQGVTREGIGTGEAVDEKGIKKAEHDALKRAAVKFGIARELYRKDDEPPARQPEESPIAETIADLVTPKQLVAIRAIANAVSIDPEKRSLERYGCKPEELTKRAASVFIDALKAERTGEDRPARRAP